MHMKFLAPLAAGMLVAAVAPALAATKTATMSVSATVLASCNVSAANLAFGNYDASAPLTGSADVTVFCSKGTPYTVLLSTGGGTFAQRLLANGANKLQYNLFTTSGLNKVWGDGTASSDMLSGTGKGLSSSNGNTHTIYGQLPNSTANQDAPVGNYTDTITVTVSY